MFPVIWFLFIPIILLAFSTKYYKNKSEGDFLTDCYNKRWFMIEKNSKLIRMMKAVHNKKIKNFGALFIDIDKFKEVNDTKGHDYGDKVIKNVVAGIRYACSEGGVKPIVVRYGGDEFICVVEDTNINYLEAIGNRIKTDVLQLSESSVSVGGAIYTDEDDIKVDEFIERIDGAMYVSKKHSVVIVE